MIQYIAGVGIFGHNPYENGISATITRTHPMIIGRDDAVDIAEHFITRLLNVINDVNNEGILLTSSHVASAPFLEPGYDITWHGVSIMCGTPYRASLEEIYMTPDKVRYMMRVHNSLQDVIEALMLYIRTKIVPNTKCDLYRGLSLSDEANSRLLEITYNLFMSRHPNMQWGSFDQYVPYMNHTELSEIICSAHSTDFNITSD